MKLLNIRLDSKDVARVRALRARGVNVSYLVREAIRVEHDRRALVPRGREVERALAAIYAEHPVTKEDRQRFDPHHRRQFRKAVRRYLRRPRRR